MEITENSEQPMFPISTAARMLKISVHTLRMYEKEGLIIPFKKETKHRLYSRADIDRLNCIRKAINEFKISISGIKTIYSLIPCWQITNCSDEDRQNCNAFIAHNNPCWTFRHNKNTCENKVCRECIVYKDYAECGDIKELIKNLTSSQPQA
jgi:MerR family transcriptional regulator/heat shock protein HspR